jgi:predicted short-subunit dehydrogenase-like oxidoreductase (DUF2520 family)
VDDNTMRIGVIGAGTVGTALALALADRGYPVVAVASRRVASAAALASRIPGCRASATPQAVVDAADLVLLTVPDDAIRAVADGVRWRPGVAAVHCSGAAGLDVLAAAAAAGAAVGSCHPLQSFADAGEALRALPGSTFALEGDGALLARLELLVRDLGGRPLRLPPGAKALYHASAVLAGNYLVTLAQTAAELWAAFGLSREEALAALLPLLRGTVDNLERVGVPRALTGPIARGDAGTVRRHLAALGDRAPHVVELYRRLGLATIPIAVDKGTLTAEAAGRLRALLSAPAASTAGTAGESCATEALARGLQRQEAAAAGTEGESCA